MGDPSELAVQLAAIHRPFWGFAYSISKWLLWIFVIVTIFTVIGSESKFLDFNSAQRDDSWYIQSEDPSVNRLVYVEPNCTDSSDGYTFTVTRAAIQQKTYAYQDGETYTRTHLTIEVKVTSSILWADNHFGMQAFWGTDNLGEIYAYSTFQTADHMHCWRTGRDALTQYYYFQIDVDNPDTLTWFELHYDRAGRDIVLHIDLTGGGSQ